MRELFRLLQLRKYVAQRQPTNNESSSAFALPSVIVISTALMIIGMSVLQSSVSVKNALGDLYYTSLAKEAAEAGAALAASCFENDDVSWSSSNPLGPNTLCNGTDINSTAADTVLNISNTVRTTFSTDGNPVAEPGYLSVTIVGRTEVLRASNQQPFKTYEQIVKKIITSAPDGIAIVPTLVKATYNNSNQSSTYFLGSDFQVYGSGWNAFGQLGNAAVTNQTIPAKFTLPTGLTAKAMSPGDRHACVLASDNNVYCAGYNDGHIGDGTAIDRSTPVKFNLASSLRAVRLSVGVDHSCVVATDRQTYCSGANSLGQIGDGTTTWRYSPTKMNLPATLTSLDVQAGDEHICTLASDNQAYCSGRNNYGQLGDATTTNRSTPVKFNIGATFNALEMNVGLSNTCVIRSDRQLYCTGLNNYGQLGDATTTNRSTPVKFNISASLTVISSVISSENICVVASDYQMYCAGRNNYGQLGDGSTTNRSTPVKFNLPASLTAKNAAVGYSSLLCVIASDNQTYCAGRNQYGQLGDGSTTNRSTPVKFILPTNITAQSVSPNNEHTCVVSSDDKVYCAGHNVSGQLGNGTTTATSTPTAHTFSMSTTSLLAMGVHVTPRETSSYVLASDGSAYGSGLNSFGQLSDGTLVNKSTAVKFNLGGALKARNIAPGHQHACATGSDFRAYCSGRNNYGQLGDGSFTQRTNAVDFGIPSNLRVRKVVAQELHTCAIASDNLAYCSGYNSTGKLADNSSTHRSVPVRYGSNTSFSQLVKDISISFYNTCVIAADNQAYCSGSNTYGQIGNGNTTNQYVPTRFNIPAGLTVLKITNGLYHNCVLASDRQVYCSGRDTDGQVGNDASYANISTPARFVLPGTLTAKKVLADEYFTCVIASDNQQYCSGYGPLGDDPVAGEPISGTGNKYALPVRSYMPSSPSGMTVLDSYMGKDHICSLSTDFQAYCVIYDNFYGKAGIGSTASSNNSRKYPLASGLSVTSLSPSADYTCALASDHKVYCAGINSTGVLGDTTTTNRSSPVQYVLNFQSSGVSVPSEILLFE